MLSAFTAYVKLFGACSACKYSLLILWSDQCYILPMDTKMTAPRLADVVAREIEQRVLEGRLKPGDRLPSERDLSVQLGVSRASLREAIHKLAARGMLTQRESADLVRQFLAHMGEPCETVIRLHHIDGYSDEEVVRQGWTRYSTTDSLKIKRSDCMKKLIQIARQGRSTNNI